MVFECVNTCVVHAPAGLMNHERTKVLSMLEGVLDITKLSAVQFLPQGLIRLTFKESADKDNLVELGKLIIDGHDCDVTNSDRPNTTVYVHHFPAEGDDNKLTAEFGHYGKIISVKRQTFLRKPNLLTGTRIITMSLTKPIPAQCSF